jgi:ribosomal protein S18 acetylase RimI-like enzyme
MLMSMVARLRADDPSLCHTVFDQSATRLALAQLLASEHIGRAWLIQRDGQNIGYLILTHTYSLEFAGRVAFIDELWLAPEHRGHGIGTQAIAHAEREARAAGIACILLEVSPDNTAAKRLYRRLGFDARAYRLMYKRL